MKTRTRWMRMALLLFATALLAGCSSTNDDIVHQRRGAVDVQGNVAGQAAPAGARVAAQAAPLAAPLAALAGDTAVLMVDETGKVAASQVVTPANGRFSLSVPEGHDYVMIFRQGSDTGRNLGILTPDATGLTTISLPAGAAGLDLGDIELDPKTGKARCLVPKTVTHAETEFPDGDSDGLPDVCDDSDDEDGDLVADGQDAFPFDDSESEDTDDDGIGDNADDDDDDDGVADGDDDFPKDRTETADTDGDGVGDNSDAFINDPAASTDTDGDGHPDGWNANATPAQIAASTLSLDAYPNDPAASADTDGDGYPDGWNANATPAQIAASPLTPDAFPGDPAEWADMDGDGTGDNADPDIDGDGVANTADAFPTDAARFADYSSPATILAPLAGGTQTSAVAVNEAGLIAGHSEPAPGANVKAVSWSATGGAATQLPPLAGAPADGFSAAFGVNQAGAIVGEAEDGNGGFKAVAWPSTTESPAMLASLGAGDTFSAAFGINTDGMIVGEAEDNAFNTRAVLWSSSSAAPVNLGVLPGGLNSTAYAINDAGFIVGESEDSEGRHHAVAWEPFDNGHIIIDLGLLSEAESTAVGINAAGVAIGESEASAGRLRAMAWIPDPVTGDYTPRELGSAAAENAATGIAGNRIVGFRDAGTADEAVVWDVTSTSPSLTEAITGAPSDSQAYGAAANGTVVGKAGSAGFAAAP